MSRRPLTLWAASLAVLRVSASAIPGSELFTRQSTCAANFNPCQNAGFPDYFCCPPGQSCIPLAGNTTVLCCPTGATGCETIRPLPCDISLQDGEKNPDAVVKTTALGGTLERCGSNCCPFGYSCNNDKCVRDQNQDAVPKQTSTPRPGPTSTANSPSSTSPTKSTATGVETSSTPDSTSPAESASTTSGSPDEASNESSGPPVAAIAGGAAAGAVVLIVAAVLAFIFLRKKKAKERGSPPKLSRSTSSFGNLISNPILGENTAIRTDFARGPGPREPVEDPDSVTGALIADSMSQPQSSGMLAVPPPTARKPENQSNIAYGYGGPELQEQYVKMPYVDHDSELLPQTPRQNREPSSVSINVFAHPDITPDGTPETNANNRYTNMTTFTQMLDKADLGDFARGNSSYVPYQPDGGNPPMPRR